MKEAGEGNEVRGRGGVGIITSYNGAPRFVSSIKPFSPFAIGVQARRARRGYSIIAYPRHIGSESRWTFIVLAIKPTSNAGTFSACASRNLRVVHRRIMNFPDTDIERPRGPDCRILYLKLYCP